MGVRLLRNRGGSALVELAARLVMWLKTDVGIPVCSTCHAPHETRVPGEVCYERGHSRDCHCIGLIKFKTFDELDVELEEREQEEYLRYISKHERQWD